MGIEKYILNIKNQDSNIFFFSEVYGCVTGRFRTIVDVFEFVDFNLPEPQENIEGFIFHESSRCINWNINVI